MLTELCCKTANMTGEAIKIFDPPPPYKVVSKQLGAFPPPLLLQHHLDPRILYYNSFESVGEEIRAELNW